MRREEGEGACALWSAVAAVPAGEVAFCFLVDGRRVVLSRRHARRALPGAPVLGLREVNVREVRGARGARAPPRAREGEGGREREGAWAVLRAFLGGVVVVSAHDSGGGVVSAQGALAFPAAGGAGDGGGGGVGLVGEDALAAGDLVAAARVPVAALYLGCVYFACVGAAVLARGAGLA